MAQILVVDDQEDIVQLVVKALELQNHKVTGLTSVLDLDKNSLPHFVMRFVIRWIVLYSLLQPKRKRLILFKA